MPIPWGVATPFTLMDIHDVFVVILEADEFLFQAFGNDVHVSVPRNSSGIGIFHFPMKPQARQICLQWGMT